MFYWRFWPRLRHGSRVGLASEDSVAGLERFYGGVERRGSSSLGLFDCTICTLFIASGQGSENKLVTHLTNTSIIYYVMPLQYRFRSRLLIIIMCRLRLSYEIISNFPINHLPTLQILLCIWNFQDMSNGTLWLWDCRFVCIHSPYIEK